MKRPNGYWNNKENVFKEARKYQTRGEFFKGCVSAYIIAHRNSWLSEMTWFKEIKKPNGYWTRERVFAEARKYQTKIEFRKCCSGAYNVARKNGWINEMDWFVSPQKPSGYWNIKENVFEEARKYQTRKEFQKGCSRAYTVARKNGLLDELFPKKSVA